MELQHCNVKIFVEDSGKLDFPSFNPIFQKWIREKATGDLLIDVADYLHVPEGPGMVLVGLEADYAMDHTDGRWGLRYNRKAVLPGNNSDRLRSALKCALEACLRLETDPLLAGKIKFRTDEIQIFINDRALAPNTPETWQALQKDFQTVLEKLYQGNSFRMEPATDPRARFGVRVNAPKAPTLAQILKNLG
jgi:hypothetical protein